MKLEEIKNDNSVKNDNDVNTDNGVIFGSDGTDKKIKVKKEKTPMDKAKKKKIIKRSILGAVAAIIILFIVVNSVAAKNRAAIVYTTEVTRQDIDQVLSTSGTVQTQESKTYFSQVESKIGHIDVALGDNVKKGDVIFTYDETALADEKQLAQLRLQSSEGEYKSAINKNNKYIGELSEANINLGVLKQQIEDSENYVNQLKQKIEEKQNALAYEGTLLQISLMEWGERIEEQQKDYVKSNDKETKAALDYSEEVYLELQKQIQYNSYEQQHNKDIVAWQDEVNKYNEMIADYKAYESEMKAQKSTSESAALDSGSKEQLEANTQINSINAKETLTAIEAVEKGVVAEFDGVITEFSVIEGGTMPIGTQLLTLASTENVKVGISVSKYDLEKIALGQEAEITIAGNTYKGVVEKINGMATTNASGAAVVGADIRIENPDSNIFLGVEAKVAVNTASSKQTLAVPIEVINSDKDGDFVYTVENGILTKKRIAAGVSSESYCEVLEGLNEGDMVVTNVTVNLEEGMAVTAVPPN